MNSKPPKCSPHSPRYYHRTSAAAAMSSLKLRCAGFCQHRKNASEESCRAFLKAFFPSDLCQLSLLSRNACDRKPPLSAGLISCGGVTSHALSLGVSAAFVSTPDVRKIPDLSNASPSGVVRISGGDGATFEKVSA